MVKAEQIDFMHDKVLIRTQLIQALDNSSTPKSVSLLKTSTMPPFHSTLPSPGPKLGNMALMPLRQTTKGSARGPAPLTTDEDIIDQSINLFKVWI